MRTRIKFEFRRRTKPSDDIAQLHETLISILRKSHWWKPGTTVSEPDLQRGLEGQVSLTPGLKNGFVGYVAYVYRSSQYTGNTAEFDDRLVLEGDVDSAIYRRAVGDLFPVLIEAFQPYRAAVIQDEDLALDDWDAASEIARESGIDADGRDGIVRFSPVCFYDDELCFRALRISGKELVSRLRDSVEGLRLMNDGVLLVVTSSILDRDRLIALDQMLRTKLALQQ